MDKMIYNDRVTFIIEEYGEGSLGEEIYLGEKKVTIPAYQSPLTHNQQMGYFGTYKKNAFKLHLQGIHEGIERIKYKDIEYDVSDVRYHMNATVLVIE